MSLQRIPRGFLYAGLILLIAAMIPPALIARQRATFSEIPRIHLMQDMGVQHRFGAQSANPMFRDGRGMRPEAPGTVARGELREDDHYYRGTIVTEDGIDWADTFPAQVRVDRALLEFGRQRYNIYCATCHGTAGYGDGMINERAMLLQSGGINDSTWVPATNLHEQMILDMPVGQIYQVIREGVRNMPRYDHLIPVEDRWAIVAYIRALQRSQGAQIEVLGFIDDDVDVEEDAQ